MSVIDEASTITRFDCVALIMTAIGMPHNFGEEAYGSAPVYSPEDSEALYKDFLKSHITDSLFKFNTTPYISYPISRKTGVIFGENKDENNLIYFMFQEMLLLRKHLRLW